VDIVTPSRKRAILSCVSIKMAFLRTKWAESLAKSKIDQSMDSARLLLVGDGSLLFAAPALAPAPDFESGRRLKRRRHTPSSLVCVNCRKNKLGCDKTRPCRRCVLQNRADSCLSWREAKTAKTEENTIVARDEPAASDADCENSDARSTSTDASPAWDGPYDMTTALLNPDDFFPAAPDFGIDGQDSDTTAEWSDDETDSFSKDLQLLSCLPMPADFDIPVRI